MLPFIGKLPLAAHNAPFDMGVLRAVLEWYGLKKPACRNFCTLALSRRIWPELKSHALGALAENFGIVYEAHNALADARTCGDIVCRAAHKKGVDNLTKLLKAAGTRMSML
jgi:DNA polymerase-3 subunit epsilon